MTRVMGWSPTEMREREDAFAALVDDAVTRVGHRAVRMLNESRVLVAVGATASEQATQHSVDIGAVTGITGVWADVARTALAPALVDTYHASARAVAAGIATEFPDLVLNPVSDSFAEDYLAKATNRLVGIGDHIWQLVRQELLVGFNLGESTTKLRDRVAAAAQVSQGRANVIARTEVNAAANAGAQMQVTVSGLTGTKEWLDTNDSRTRCTHRAAGGQTVAVDGLFTLGGNECGVAASHLMFPGDPTAPPRETIQCRCSVAYDLSLEDDPLTAAATEVNSGGMIALIPTADDANSMVLDGDGAEPASDLHCTLLFLGDAMNWSAEERRLLLDVVAELTERYVPIATTTFSVNIFNPVSDDFDTAVVLGVRGTDLLVALHQAISTNVTDIFDDEVPPQHTPWVPHITLAYSDDRSIVTTAMKKLGPVTFDRVRVVFAGETTDFPLIGTPMTAAAEFVEAEHPRDAKGKFAKKPGIGDVAEFLAHLEAQFNAGALKDGSVIATWKNKDGIKERFILVTDTEGNPAIQLQRIILGKWDNFSSTYLHDKKSVKMWVDDIDPDTLTISPGAVVAPTPAPMLVPIPTPQVKKSVLDLPAIWKKFYDEEGYADGEVIATGKTHGKNVRLVARMRDGDHAIVEQYDDGFGHWTENDYWISKNAFLKADLSGYSLTAHTGEEKSPTHRLDAVPPAFTQEGDKVKYTDPLGVPDMLKLAADPGKSGDGWTKRADGKTGPWGRYGAAGVLLRHRGADGVDRYLLVQRGKSLDHAGEWQLPGGGLDSKETPFQGAAREIVEELGFTPDDVGKGRVHGFHEVTVPLAGGKEWKYTSIAATVPDQLVPDLSGENAQLETADAKWLTLDEIQKLDDEGKLLKPLAKGKWRENMVDLFPKDTGAPETSDITTGEPKTPTQLVESGDFTQLKRITPQKGTNPGGIFEAPDGSRWYVKQQKDQAHSDNEHDAAALYRAAGIDVPEVIQGYGAPSLDESKPQTATRIVPGAKSDLAKKLKDPEYVAKVRRGFAVDAWLGNYDAAGLTLDNIISDENSNPIRIDVGGALEFRAQGKAKGPLFGTSVGEWDALRSPKGDGSVLAPSQAAASKVFKDITPEQLSESVKLVQDMTPEKIRATVGDGPLADKLITRREDLLKRAEKEGVLPSSEQLLSEAEDVDFEFTDTPHPADLIAPQEPSSKAASLGMTEAEYQDLLSKVQEGDYTDTVDTTTPTSIKPAIGPDAEGTPLDNAKADDVWKAVQEGFYANGETVTGFEDAFGNKHRLVVGTYAGKPTLKHEIKYKGMKSWSPYNVYTSGSDFTQDKDLPEFGIGSPAPSLTTDNSAQGIDPVGTWSMVQKGIIPNGTVLASYVDGGGNTHRLVVADSVGKIVIKEQVKGKYASGAMPGDWAPHSVFFDESSFISHVGNTPDYGFGTPGSAALPGGPPVLPRANVDGMDAVDVWTNVHLGTWPEGTVLASYTDGDMAHRLVVGMSTLDGKPIPVHEVHGPYDPPGEWVKYGGFNNPKQFKTHMHTYPQFGIPNASSGTGATSTTSTAVSPQPTTLWQKVQTGTLKPNDLIASYISKSGYTHELRVAADGKTIQHWTKSPSVSKPKKIKESYSTEAELLAADLTEFKIDPNELTATPAEGSHHALWQEMASGQFTPGLVVGEYKDPQGLTHQLVVNKGKPGFTHIRKPSNKNNPDTIVETWTDPDHFAAADLSKFTVPGSAKKATSLPFIAKLTNAIIYGKYNDGDVIATYNDGSARLVYKNNKIVLESKADDNAPWTTSFTWGKAEAYKKLNDKSSLFKQGWYLGDKEAAKGSPGVPVVTSAPTPLKPKVTPTPPIPTVKPVSSHQKGKIKYVFEMAGVKWHSAAPKMLEAAVEAQKKNPDLTLGQILAVMDDTTKTKTSPTPFTDKIKKYLNTYQGKQHAKYGLKLPADQLVLTGQTNATPKVGTSTPGSSTSTTKSVLPSNLKTAHEFSEAGSHTLQAPPGGYKIHSNAEMSAIQKQMHAQYGDWTSTQKAALTKYTGSFYATVNKCLRKPETCTSSVTKDAESIAAGMRPLTTSIRVTRGTGWGAIPGLSSKHTMTDAERLAHLQAATGKLLTEPAFMSTSSASKPAFGGALRFIIDVPAGTPAAWVQHISHYKSENELLLAPGLKYRIKKVEPGGGGYGNPHLVYLEVVYP